MKTVLQLLALLCLCAPVARGALPTFNSFETNDFRRISATDKIALQNPLEFDIAIMPDALRVEAMYFLNATPLSFAYIDSDQRIVGAPFMPQPYSQNLVEISQGTGKPFLVWETGIDGLPKWVQNTQVNVKMYGATGDGVTDDTAAIQAAMDAAAANSQPNTSPAGSFVQQQVILPAPSVAYRITAPLLVTNSYVSLVGVSAGVVITNSTEGSDLIRVNVGGAQERYNIEIRNLTLRGTGASSKAIHASGVYNLLIEDVNTFWHPGPSVYMDSSTIYAWGCVHACLRRVVCHPDSPVTAVTDIKGLGTIIENCRMTEADIGIDLVEADQVTIISPHLEQNDRDGSNGIAIRMRHGDSTEGWRGQQRKAVTIISANSENNRVFIDADETYFVTIQGGHVEGGPLQAYGDLPLRQGDRIILDGGGKLVGVNSISGVLISSASGTIDVEDCTGIIGRVDSLRVKGFVPPFDFSTGTNLANQSWFDADVSWAAGGTYPPTFSYTNTASLYGSYHKSIAFPAAATLQSVAQLSSASVATTSGDIVNQAFAFQSDVAGEWMLSRMGDETACYWQTDTNWTWVIMGARTATTGTTPLKIATYLTANPAELKIGALGVAVNRPITMRNTAIVNGGKKGELQFGRSLFADNLTLAPNKNVGIGIINPSEALHIVRPISGNAYARFDTIGTTLGLITGVDSLGNGYLYHFDEKPIFLGIGNSIRLTIGSTGNVGIGDSTPEGLLTVGSGDAFQIDSSGMMALPDNVRQTFNPGATVSGLNVGQYPGDPSTPANGDVWYNQATHEYRGQTNGVPVIFSVTPVTP